jgi:2,4-dienoyl-CoA reductase-like NADH-dependent reductase (Old Yellow Enzyme family)
MTRLFETTSINGLIIHNRFVRSATWEGMANPDGTCTKRLIDLMIQLAKGGVGLIISGNTSVSPEGQAGPWHLGIYDDRFIPGLLEMTTAVHRAGGKIVMQISHAGCQSHGELTGQQPIGPSVLMGETGVLCREMTVEEIRMIVDAFGQAALRVRKAGCDGVQIHAAHGYLLSEFMSPFFNKREDVYGGNIENRARIVREVLHSTRRYAGADFPVMIKLNASDFLEGGLNIDGMLATASLLEKDRIDAIELSGGTAYSGKNLPIRTCKVDSGEDDVFYLDAARRYKERIAVPLMLVGGIRSFSTAERLAKDNVTDYVCLSRPLICEPGLINRWKSGDTRRSDCKSDNICFKSAKAGKGIYCALDKKPVPTGF